jgi:hypothetical protein
MAKYETCFFLNNTYDDKYRMAEFWIAFWVEGIFFLFKILTLETI